MAGGALVLCGCLNGQGCCNANPDPCCGITDMSSPFLKMECSQAEACRADGGHYFSGYQTSAAPDATIVPGHCQYLDGGADASPGDGGAD
jgi:hypothetical protein